MAWMPKSEAAAALGLSPLVLSRQIAVGRFRTKTVGRKVLVEIGEAEKQRSAARLDNHPLLVGSEAPSHLPYEPPQSADTSESITDRKSDRPAQGEGDKRGTPESPAPVVANTMPVAPPRKYLTALHEEEILAATLDAVDKVRAYCDQESAQSRIEAEQAWSSCEKAERRLRRVACVAATVLVAAIIGVGWLDRIHSAERESWRGKIESVQAALKSEQARQQGESDSIRAVLESKQIELERTRETLQNALTRAKSDLAASQNENDYICWERDEAMHDLDRLANEVALQREHIEKLQSIQATTAARSLRDLLDETWDLVPNGPAEPPTAPAVSTDTASSTQLTARQ